MDNSVVNRDNYVIEGCIIHSFPHRPRKKLALHIFLNLYHESK